MKMMPSLPVSAIVAINLFLSKPAVAFSPITTHSRLFFCEKYSGVWEVMASRTSSTSLSLQSSSWRSGTDLLQLDPSTLSQEGADGNRPQLAKDEDYASAVLAAWKDEVDKRIDDDGGGSVASPIEYNCKSDGSSLYGHIYQYRPSSPTSESTNNNDSSTPKSLLPGIILFHTGAGPQDIFLRWKADSLVHEQPCVVLIADILGDKNGWAWYDRERYQTVRQSVLLPDEHGNRNELANRVQAAIDTLASQQNVDSTRIAAMGFCLGGHPITELARMKHPSVRAMVTFHGVFDGVTKLSSSDAETSSPSSDNNTMNDCSILICTGKDDPFVPSNDLDAAIKMFSDLGYHQTELMEFENTRHGFTNPAQDFNPSEAFGYCHEAYTKAWSAALTLLSKSLSKE